MENEENLLESIQDKENDYIKAIRFKHPNFDPGNLTLIVRENQLRKKWEGAIRKQGFSEELINLDVLERIEGYRTYIDNLFLSVPEKQKLFPPLFKHILDNEKPKMDKRLIDKWLPIMTAQNIKESEYLTAAKELEKMYQDNKAAFEGFDKASQLMDAWKGKWKTQK